MLLRYAMATIAATVVTFALFFLMQSLITIDGRGDDGTYATRVIDFVRLKRAEATQSKQRELPKRRASQDTPTPPPMTIDTSADAGPSSNAISVELPSIETSLDLSGGPHLGTAPSDTDAIPLVRVNPQYPHSAAQQKVEGWVQVEFNISATGVVADPKVVKAHPPGIFERAAISAIRKWKYKPKIKDGKAIERHNVRVQLTFELQDEE
ncbi:MAG: hypothetical protein A2289_05980 [Deltaproteobacteria bacterium RIFOXYA12_FULL_58_15]|nr:MAG: hypothetical protein A2289_05980 [Deltaproteobacteria bacterium RIFOXYA12_FULL_58_15]OGR09153.1 MAG: hypothetical protein A2341_02830 [Deltaproteobacteria bacterium RIFOXYB12_FULL_58_9]